MRQEGGQCPWLSISPPLLLLNSDPTSSPALPPGQAGAASQLPAALQLLTASNSHHAGGPGSEAKRTLRSRDQEPRPEQAAVGSPNPSTCPAQCLPMGGDAGSGAALSPPWLLMVALPSELGTQPAATMGCNSSCKLPLCSAAPAPTWCFS